MRELEGEGSGKQQGFTLWNSPPIGAAKLQDTPTAHAAANSSLL